MAVAVLAIEVDLGEIRGTINSKLAKTNERGGLKSVTPGLAGGAEQSLAGAADPTFGR